MADDDTEVDGEKVRIGAALEAALAGVNVREAAEVAGVSSNTLRRMFRGRGLDLVRVLRLEERYGFSLSGNAGALPRLARSQPDIVEVPVLTTAASAGAGILVGEIDEERGTVPLPSRWARRFGTPARLRLVEIVGDSMTPDLEEGDWLLVNLDNVEVREGIALVRLDDSLYVKRLQPRGRELLLLSSNERYPPVPVDLGEPGEKFAVIGRGVGRWSARRLS